MLHYTYDSDKDLPSTFHLILAKTYPEAKANIKAMTILWSEVIKWQL